MIKTGIAVVTAAFLLYSGPVRAGEEDMKESLARLREYSSSVQTKEQSLRLLQLDLEKARVEHELKKIGTDIPLQVSDMAQEQTSRAQSLAVTLRSVVSTAGIRRGCFQFDSRQIWAREKERVGGFEVSSLDENGAVLTGARGETIVLRAGL